MFNWIILGFFLAAMTWHLIRAICKPMIKNLLTLVAVPIALLITSVLHRIGLFKWGAAKLLTLINLDEKISEIITKFLPVVSALLAPALFVLMFRLVFCLLKIFYVNLVTAYIQSRRAKREKNELKAAIAGERKRLEETIRENEERNRALMEALPLEQQEAIVSEYEPFDEDDIEDMVDERIKEEKKRRKKQGYFRESSENKLISIFSGLLCGFLIFAISWTPIFYFMDIVGEITETVIEGGEYEEGDPKTKLYLVVETLDEYFVEPYHNSPVIKLYEDTGIVDLLINTVQKGSKITETQGGDPVYANEIAKLYLSRSVRLACAMMDMNYSDDFIRDDMEDMTINSPVYQNGVDMIAGFLVDYMEENPDFANDFIKEGEDGEPDIISMFLGQIIGIYQNGIVKEEVAEDGTVTKVVIKTNKDVIKDDFNALTDVVIIFSENKLIAKIVNNHSDMGGLIGDKEFVSAMIGAVSKLTPYKPAMETVFTFGIGMLGEMQALGIPKDNAEGYDSFIAQLVAGANNVTAIDEAGREEIQKLFIAAAEFQIKDSALAFVEKRIADLEANIAKREQIMDFNDALVSGTVLGLTDEELTDFIGEDADLAYLATLNTKLVNGEALTEEEIADLNSKTLTQEYIIADLQSELDGKPAVGEEGSEGYVEAEKGYFLIREELISERTEATTHSNILQYIADPLYVVEVIYKQEGKHIEHLIQQLDAAASDAEDKQVEIQQKITDLEEEYAELGLRIFELEGKDSLTAEEELELANAKARSLEIEAEIPNLNSEIDSLAQDIKNLLGLSDVMTEQATVLSDESSKYLKEAETRLKEFTPFMTYFMNWTSMQKPLLLAGEDTSSACLSIVINGKAYVCNTDEISIEEILDLALKGNDNSIEGTTPGEDEGGEGSEGTEKFPEIDVDAYLDKIPMKALFERINITEVTESNKDSYVGRVSPYTNLVNFLIAAVSDHKAQESAGEIDQTWLFDALSRYASVLSETESYVEDKTVELINRILSVTEENKNEFDYKGITLDALLGTLNFDAWDNPESNAKEEDTQKLVDVIFAFVDLLGKLGEQGQDAEEPAPAADEGTEDGQNSDLTGLLEMFKGLGKTFDVMAETECLGDLPATMLKVILTNPMFGQIMTTSMLYHDDVDNSKDGYLVQIDYIAENHDPANGISYETFMNGFVEKVLGLLDKLNQDKDDDNQDPDNQGPEGGTEGGVEGGTEGGVEGGTEGGTDGGADGGVDGGTDPDTNGEGGNGNA